MGDNLTSERQARELAKLPTDQQADAFIEASERTNGKPTAAAIKAVVQERTAPAPTFGDINTGDEPTARDERPEPDDDEAERKAEGKRLVEDAPIEAFRAASQPLAFSARCRTDARILALEIFEQLGGHYAACVEDELHRRLMTP